ncbi:zinc ribbon domain-containing protein [Chloroflexota bacterium]
MVGRSAKSHRYYYYTCNRSCKQGREACNSRILPEDKIERLVIDQIKSKILDGKCLEELARLVNAELDAGHVLIKEKTSNIDSEIYEVENRLTRLYDALESGKLDLNDLALRIKELRAKQDEPSKARVVAEAEMTLQGYHQLDIDAVRSYWNILDESEVAQRKAFLRWFVKKIVVEKKKVKLCYNFPVPPDGRKMVTMGRTFELALSLTI